MQHMESFIAQVVNGLATGSIYALIVLGMNVLVLVRDIVHQGYAHIIMITMASGWITLNTADGSIALAIIVMVVVAILLTVATEPLFRPLCKRGAQLETIVLAMSVGIILTEVMSQFVNSGGNFAFPASMRGGGITLSFGLIRLSLANIIALVSAVIVAVLLLWFMNKTQLGRAIRAMAQNLRVAKMLGIPFGTTGVIGFGIAGLLAAIIAILIIMTIGTCGPSLGDTFAVKSVILMLFAGMGNLKGGLLSALFMGLIEAMALAYLPGSWTQAIFYGVIMIVIIWKPNGLFGTAK